MIEFFCPNEHKIRCPDEMAGRSAKCPKCGASFRIPRLEELGLDASTISTAATGEEVTEMPPLPATADGSGRQAASPTSEAPPAKERQIEFLCPNGHHLHGPASLQGRAGECPECGSRFHIPVVDEPDAGSILNPPAAGATGTPLQVEMLLESSLAADPGVATAPGEPLEFLQVLDVAGSGTAQPIGGGGAVSGPAGLSGGGVSAIHPLAALFMELWAARDDSSRVEVHLESGSVLQPDGYVKPFSLQDYAALVTKDPDGSSTVSIVPWNSIARIILRSLKEVPGEVVR